MKRDYVEFQERWTEEHIGTAVENVVSGQGGELPKFD